MDSNHPSYWMRLQWHNNPELERVLSGTLKLAGKSVTETAFECGYNDVSYFSSVFKKRTGLSPKQYSKQFRQNL